MNPVRQVENVNACKAYRPELHQEEKESTWSMVVNTLLYVVTVALAAFAGFIWA